MHLTCKQIKHILNFNKMKILQIYKFQLRPKIEQAKQNLMEMFGDSDCIKVLFDFEHQKELEAERLREIEMEADA